MLGWLIGEGEGKEMGIHLYTAGNQINDIITQVEEVCQLNLWYDFIKSFIISVI